MTSVLAPASAAGASRRSMTASPASPPAAATATTLEDVALRLFHLLHSPPLSLATLVRAGLLAEEEDVQGRRTLVLPTPAAASPNTASHSAIGANLADRAAAPPARDEALSSTLSGPTPAVGDGGLSRSTATTHIDGDTARVHSNLPLAERRRRAAAPPLPPLSTNTPADTIGSPVTASTLSVSSPTAAAGATSLRIARISADGLAHRLADLYAHHPPYALREWLHREATRLACPTYQDPVSNDITATADALRQREELVTLYTRLYEQRHSQGPAVRGEEEEVKEDSAVVAWRRGLHLLMGCHHVRERHCPHRALDSFTRTSTPAPARAGVVVPLLRQAAPPGVRKDASVALHFVQQLLRSTPAASRRQRRLRETWSVEGGHQHTTTTTTTTSAGKRGMEQQAVTGGGATVTFVRPPEGTHVYQGAASAVRGQARVSAAPHTLDAVSSAATDVTSLDCMIGVGDIVEVQNIFVAATTTLPPDAAAPGAVGTPSSFSVIPVRRGPRIRLRRAAENVHDVRGDERVDKSFIAADASTTSHSSSSSSSSSSLSLPVAREEGEDELSLSESGEEDEYEEEEEEEEEEDDGESVADDPADTMRRHSNSAAEGKWSEVVGGLLHRGSRQSSQFPTLSAGAAPSAAVVPTASSTATTVDFLTSRTGGLLSAAALAGAPLTAAAVSRMASSSSNPAHEPVAALSVHELSVQLGEPHEQQQQHQQQQEAVAHWAQHPEELPQHVSPSTPLLAGYSLTRPFTLAELPPAEAAALLRLPFYAQAHELNRLSGLRRRSCYQDPYTHCLILTSRFLEGLPHCYGEYCTHCPHGEVCQRRLLHPADPQPRHHRHRGTRRRHRAWRVGKVRAAFDPTSTNAPEWVQRGEGSSSSSSGVSGSDSSPEDDDDEDDAEALRFFAALDAAETSAPNAGASVVANTGMCAPSDLQQQQQPQKVSASVQCLPQSSSGAVKSMSDDRNALLRPFSSHSAPSNLSASSSSSSSELAASEGDEDPDEQHRHHLLRSYGDVVAGSGAGVVVQVNSLRDLLAWGAGNLADDATADSAAAAGHLLAGGLGSLVAAAPDRAARIGSEMDVEELLRRHEASLEQYTYLDSSGL